MRGSIRKRGANSWEIKIELERINGKRHRRFVTVKGTYKDAQKELTRLLSSADDETRTAQHHIAAGSGRDAPRSSEVADRASAGARAGRATIARFQHHRGRVTLT